MAEENCRTILDTGEAWCQDEESKGIESQTRDKVKVKVRFEGEAEGCMAEKEMTGQRNERSQ